MSSVPGGLIFWSFQLVKWIAFALKDLFDIALVGGIFIAFFIKTKYPSATRSLGLGLLASAFFGLLLRQDIIRITSDRQLQDGLIDIVAFIAAGALLATVPIWFFRGEAIQGQGRKNSLLAFYLGAIFALLFLPRMIGFVRLGERLVFQASMFNSDVLMQSFGLVLGALLGVLILWSVVKASDRVSNKGIMVVALIALIPGQAINAINALRVLSLNRYIVLDSSGMGLLIDLINSQQILNIAIYSAALLVLPLALLAKTPVLFEPDNPAMVRKQKSAARSQLRWIYMLFACLLSSYAVFFADNALARKSENVVSEAVQVKADKGFVKIAKSKLMDGDMHRFSYKVDGSEIKFLLLHKGSGVFGIALDACQICGAAGFYKKDDNIICSACDSVINKSTLGFQGGCNPLPLNYKVDKKYITISEPDLKAASKYFSAKGSE